MRAAYRLATWLVGSLAATGLYGCRDVADRPAADRAGSSQTVSSPNTISAAAAQIATGNAYGVPQDPVRAVTYYLTAAEQGDAYAQDNLGLMYFKGQGVPQDYALAASWYRKAAEQGYTSAQFNLAGMLFTGQGVAQDVVEARKWYLLAVAKAPPADQRRYAEWGEATGARITAEQQAEAQKAARAWQAAFEKRSK